MKFFSDSLVIKHDVGFPNSVRLNPDDVYVSIFLGVPTQLIVTPVLQVT